MLGLIDKKKALTLIEGVITPFIGKSMARASTRVHCEKLGIVSEHLKVWLALLFGFFCLAAGDILFAYFSTLGRDFLDPLLDVMFAYSYIFISWGTAYQYELLKS